uniref:ATP-dependent DNA helicase n=1 Tax=Octopus bimaculoides TaxID=37653 RepID=A0A0L8GUI2_OCTBM
MCRMKISDPRGKLFQKARLLVIDEVTMGHKHVCECVDHSLKELKQEPDKLFGGLTVLFSGNWKQTLPMVQRGFRAQIVHATLKQSYIWNHVQSLQLSVNMRVQNSGKISEYKISIPPPHLIDSTRLWDLCEVVFRGIDEKYREGLWMGSRVIITPTNKAAEEVNTVVMLKFLQGDSKTYRSCDTLHENETEFLLELINDLNPSRFSPHILVLKKHSFIMLLRNHDSAGGHCNKTRYIVLNLHNHLIEAEVANGTHAGIRIMIP